MTQLLLFDTPAGNSFAPLAPVAETNLLETNLLRTDTADSTRSAPNPQRNAWGTHQPGLNHMGDLARLVLLQYDLVAQRRAKRLAQAAVAANR